MELHPVGPRLRPAAYIAPPAPVAFPFGDDFGIFLRDFSDTIIQEDGSVFDAIFDLAYVDPLGVAGSNPRITAPVSVKVEHDEVLTIRARQYEVQTVEADGIGWYSAELKRL